MDVAMNPAGGIYAHCSAAPQAGTSTESVELRTKETPAKAVETQMEKTNAKGLKLLKGMGWKEGQGLGKNQQGIKQPVSSFYDNIFIFPLIL